MHSDFILYTAVIGIWGYLVVACLLLAYWVTKD